MQDRRLVGRLFTRLFTSGGLLIRLPRAHKNPVTRFPNTPTTIIRGTLMLLMAGARLKSEPNRSQFSMARFRIAPLQWFSNGLHFTNGNWMQNWQRLHNAQPV